MDLACTHRYLCTVEFVFTVYTNVVCVNCYFFWLSEVLLSLPRTSLNFLFGEFFIIQYNNNCIFKFF